LMVVVFEFFPGFCIMLLNVMLKMMNYEVEEKMKKRKIIVTT